MQSPDSREAILIVGTGALATLFAARLSAVGLQVTMLGSWQEALAALNERGARLADGGAFPVHAVSATAACRDTRYALVLVKAWQTERAAHALAECLAEDGLAVTLQNGLGNRETLAAALGERRVALGVTTLGATLLAAGLVRPGGEGTISIESHPRLPPLITMLSQAGFPVEVVHDAQTLLWRKLVINAAINPLTALLRVPNGGLLESPAARWLMGALAEETAAVARALGLELDIPSPALFAEEVARRTAQNLSSMLQDVLRGAPTEIDAICGAIARQGAARGVPVPFNTAMWYLVRALCERTASV
jgi:2-dehydropantoate 2-reductase